MSLRPEQELALDYARRKGTDAPPETIRRKVAATFRKIEAVLASVPGDLARRRPGDGRWSVHEIVDHLAVSHRRAVEELTCLTESRSPQDGPIPAGLLSDDPLAIEWSTQLERLRAIHRDFLAVLESADEGTDLDARAAVEMVVRCRIDEGRVEPVHWIESFDWKAYAILFRAHTLEHLHQVQRTLAAVGGEITDLPAPGPASGPGRPPASRRRSR